MRLQDSSSSASLKDAVSPPDVLEPALARLLVEVGFHAIDLGDWPRAHQIFSVLKAFRPSCDFPYVGLSMIELMKFHWDSAAQIAQFGLAQVPDSQPLAGLLAMALRNGRGS